MFIQTVMPQDIVELCLTTCIVNKVNNTTSHCLYYRKLDESSAKQYFRITDVYSNCDAVIYNGFALANCFMNAINKTTSHRLYYRKLDESSAKQYFRITDVYSNCDATIYRGIAISNLCCKQSEQYNITMFILKEVYASDTEWHLT